MSLYLTEKSPSTNLQWVHLDSIHTGRSSYLDALSILKCNFETEIVYGQEAVSFAESWLQQKIGNSFQIQGKPMIPFLPPICDKIFLSSFCCRPSNHISAKNSRNNIIFKPEFMQPGFILSTSKITKTDFRVIQCRTVLQTAHYFWKRVTATGRTIYKKAVWSQNDCVK